MNVNDFAPSTYLRAHDLQGREPTVAIAKVEQIELENNGRKEAKLLISFVGKNKGLVLNKTNMFAISDLYGPETDDWVGKKIKLVTARVDYQGKRVDAIRIDPPEKQLNPTPKQVSDSVFAPTPPAPPKGHPAAFGDEEIPF